MIKAILFDADGVVQCPGERFHQFIARNAPGGDAAQFWKVVGTAEKPCLTGAADFVDALRGALNAMGSTATIEEALDAWNDVVVDRSVLAVVRELRDRGLICALATNQNPYRAHHMRRTPKLDERFDQTFYSCDLGFAKPDLAYFHTLLSSLELEATECLFIDDSETNVRSAQSIGIRAEHVPPHGGGDEVWRVLARNKIFKNSSNKPS